MSARGRELAALAELHGVHTSYTDVHGATNSPSVEVLVALLQALGVPLHGPADAAAARRDGRLAMFRRQLEPVLVHRLAQPDLVFVTLPASADPKDVWLILDIEDGRVMAQLLSA